MTSFTEIFGGTTIYPSDTSFLALALDEDTTLEWPLEASTGANVVARIINVTPSGSYTIVLPDATQTGVGQTILFNNLGPDTINVSKAAGGTLLSLAQGEVWQIYLTNNSTVGGTWSSFQYGASTAQAQAAALAGPGIVAIGSVLAQEMDVSTITTTPYTVTTADRAAAFVWTGALGTFNLPPVVSAGQGWFINVRNGGTGDLTIDPSSSETINDASTLVMQPGDSAVLATDGVEWWTIGLGKQAIFAFDYTSIDLTGVSGNYVLSGAELNRIAYNFSGPLAGNTTVIVPPTVQQYWATNNATGYTLALSVNGSASPVNIASGEKGIYYSNGVDMVLANTVAGIPTPISIADGGTNATSATNARNNLSAAKSGANSDITSISGLASGSTLTVTFLSDSDTGIGNPSADALGGKTGGVEAFFLGTGTNPNLFFGSNCFGSATAGGQNTAFGMQAGRDLTTGTSNTYVGNSAGRNNATGIQNTLIGHQAGLGVTGSAYTVIGAASLSGGPYTGSNVTVIGQSSSPSTTSVSNEVTLGNSGVTTLRCAVTSITAISDKRDKAGIEPLPAGMDLELINTVQPRLWTWAMRDGSKVGVSDIGFVAQELQEAMAQCGVEVPGLVYESNPERIEAATGLLLPVAIRAIQQLSEALDHTNRRLRALEELLGE